MSGREVGPGGRARRILRIVPSSPGGAGGRKRSRPRRVLLPWNGAWRRLLRRLRFRLRPGFGMSLAAALGLLALWALAVPAAATPSDPAVAECWRLNGSPEAVQAFQFGAVDWEREELRVQGRAPLRDPADPGERLLARRAAATDARRRILYVLVEMRKPRSEAIEAIEASGWVRSEPPVGETVRGGRLLLDYRLPLGRVLRECLIYEGRTAP